MKKRAEEAVADVKRTAVVELQKAVTAAEGRQKEAMTALQAQMDSSISEARRQAAEEAFDLANSQEDSTEVRHHPPTVLLLFLIYPLFLELLELWSKGKRDLQWL